MDRNCDENDELETNKIDIDETMDVLVETVVSSEDNTEINGTYLKQVVNKKKEEKVNISRVGLFEQRINDIAFI